MDCHWYIIPDIVANPHSARCIRRIADPRKAIYHSDSSGNIITGIWHRPCSVYAQLRRFLLGNGCHALWLCHQYYPRLCFRVGHGTGNARGSACDHYRAGGNCNLCLYLLHHLHCVSCAAAAVRRSDHDMVECGVCENNYCRDRNFF